MTLALGHRGAKATVVRGEMSTANCRSGYFPRYSLALLEKLEAESE
jgi:hypothetical protein